MIDLEVQEPRHWDRAYILISFVTLSLCICNKMNNMNSQNKRKLNKIPQEWLRCLEVYLFFIIIYLFSSN